MPYQASHVLHCSDLRAPFAVFVTGNVQIYEELELLRYKLLNCYMHLRTFSKTCLVSRGGHQGICLARERALVDGTALSCRGSLPVLRSPVKDAIDMLESQT